MVRTMIKAFGANESRLLGSVPLQVGYLYLEKSSDSQLEGHSNWHSHLAGVIIGHLGTEQEFVNGSRQITTTTPEK